MEHGGAASGGVKVFPLSCELSTEESVRLYLIIRTKRYISCISLISTARADQSLSTCELFIL